MQKVAAGGRSGYRGAHRGDGDEEGEESKVEENKRQMEEYIDIGMAKNTKFFSKYDPDSLFEVFRQYVESQGYKFSPSQTKYKVKVSFL